MQKTERGTENVESLKFNAEFCEFNIIRSEICIWCAACYSDNHLQEINGD